jgi:hypothetical protein
MLREAGRSLGSTRLDDDWAPSIEAVLARSDTVIRGTIGEGRTYLNEDETEVLTDYPIRQATVLFDAVSPQPSSTGATITVTIKGGKVTIDGLSFTFWDPTLPALPVGRECLLLLKREGATYRLASGAYGAFAIINDRLLPITAKEGFAKEYKGSATSTAASEFIRRLRAMPKRNVATTSDSSTRPRVAPSRNDVVHGEANTFRFPVVRARAGSPKKIRDVLPVFPESERASGFRSVHLQITIGEDGKVVDVYPAGYGGTQHRYPALEQAAIDAVRQWEYERTVEDGIPVSVIVQVAFSFTCSSPTPTSCEVRGSQSDA